MDGNVIGRSLDIDIFMGKIYGGKKLILPHMLRCTNVVSLNNVQRMNVLLLQMLCSLVISRKHKTFLNYDYMPGSYSVVHFPKLVFLCR